MKSIAIIGAGITGITTAYCLLKQGYQVTIFNKNRYPAMETSYANGGQLSASNAEVWNQASTILKGIRWLFNSQAPLLFNMKPSWHKLSWITEFISHIPHYEENTIQTVQLAIRARQSLIDWARIEQIDFDYRNQGILHIYRNATDFAHASRVTRLLARGGLIRQPVTAQDIRRIEPTLSGNFYGGFFTDSDSTGDIHKYTSGLAAACERLGATLIFNQQVQQLTCHPQQVTISSSDQYNAFEHHFDQLVICAGVASRHLAAQVGDRINIYPVKGYSITIPLLDTLSQSAAPSVSLLDDSAKIVTSRLGIDRLRVAGTAEFNGFNTDIRTDRVLPLIKWVEDLFPNVNTRQTIPWTGLRPMMPNMMPKVGHGHNPHIFYNTGHGHLGWTLAPATAEWITQIINTANQH